MQVWGQSFNVLNCVQWYTLEENITLHVFNLAKFFNTSHLGKTWKSRIQQKQNSDNIILAAEDVSGELHQVKFVFCKKKTGNSKIKK